MVSKNVQLIRQIAPVLVGSFLTVSFGTMAGWPSVAFPYLVNLEITPIFITWDNTALLAGNLMMGLIVGTALSSITIYGNKTGVLIGLCSQIAGWTMLFYADNIIEIGVSRALVGLGNGFGSQQLRNYAQDTSSSNVFQLLMQYMPITLNVGVIFVYSVGSFVTFRVLSLVCVGIPIVALVIFGAVPKSVKSYSTVQIVAVYPKGKDLEKSQDKEDKADDNLDSNQLGFIEIFKDKKIRNNFIWLFFLTTVTQYTGGAANIVYSQVVYTVGFNRYPKLCSVIYASVFFISNLIALMYTKKYYRRPVLLGSCIVCSVLLFLTSCYFYFLLDLLEISRLFTWSPLFLLSLYNFFHTIGINIIPILFINDKFPKKAQNVVSKLYIIYFALSAIISTKIFQVLFTYNGMYATYLFLSAVGFAGTLVVLFFFKESRPTQKKQNIDGFHNEVDLTDEITAENNNVNTH